LEEAARTIPDAADRVIAFLDRMDGDVDREYTDDAEPSPVALRTTRAAKSSVRAVGTRITRKQCPRPW
jgi:hypothetical protein